MLRIRWTAKRTNVSIINDLDEPIRLSVLWERRETGYFVHIRRREDGNLSFLVRHLVEQREEDLQPGGQTA